MTRHITLSDNLEVGYNFLKSSYYITNRGTTTYRDNTDTGFNTIWLVLEAITNQHNVTIITWEGVSITKPQFKNLINVVEPITSLAYTFSDNGEYIKSIRINDYDDYLFMIDCDKGKLYIKNTNMIYDLTLDESYLTRLEYITLYYKQHLGLGHIVDGTDILLQDLKVLYDLLLSYYTPKVYNNVYIKEDDTLYYNNYITLSNYSNTGYATYNITCNPNNTYSDNEIANVLSSSVSNSTFTLNAVPNTQINTGDTIYISGATNTVDNVEYSADGTYTVKSYDNVTVEVNENIPYSYSFPYRKAYLINSQAYITDISRTNNTITLSNTVPSTITVGDTITVANTTRVEQSESISNDGEYQVMAISNNTITIYPTPPYNYTYSSSTMTTQGSIFKKVYLGNINLITHTNTVSILTLDTTITPLSAQNTIGILVDKTYYYYTVTYSTSSSITFTNTDSTDINYSYVPDYAQMKKHGNSPLMLLNVLSSNNTDLLPLGEFMLENLKATQDYISIYTGVLIPTSTEYNNVESKVSETKAITMAEGSIINMQLQGLYKNVYTDN